MGAVLCLVAQLCLTLCDPMDCSPPGTVLEDSPGKRTGVDCHSLLQGIFPTQGSNPGLLHTRQILYQLSYEGSPHSPWPQMDWEFWTFLGRMLYSLLYWVWLWFAMAASLVLKNMVVICFFKKIFFYWTIIALQNFVVFRQTPIWISHRHTYVPFLLNLPPISLPIPPL